MTCCWPTMTRPIFPRRSPVARRRRASNAGGCRAESSPPTGKLPMLLPRKRASRKVSDPGGGGSPPPGAPGIAIFSSDRVWCAECPEFFITGDQGRSPNVDGEIGHPALDPPALFVSNRILSAGLPLPARPLRQETEDVRALAPAWRRISARVSPYSGSTVIASNRAVPSSSYRYIEGSSRWPILLRLSFTFNIKISEESLVQSVTASC